MTANAHDEELLSEHDDETIETPAQFELTGTVLSVAEGVASTTLVPAEVLQQDFRLGEALDVFIEDQLFRGAYLGAQLPSAIEEAYGSGNLDEAEVAVTLAYDNLNRLTRVDLVALAEASPGLKPGALIVRRGGLEVALDGLTLSETPGPRLLGDEKLEVSVASVGMAGLTLLCDFEALEQIQIGPLHRLNFQIDGKLRRVLQDRPENQKNLEQATEDVIRRLPGGARLLRDHARAQQALADASVDGQDVTELQAELNDLDAQLANIKVPPSRAMEVPLVAQLRSHWDDPRTAVLWLKPLVGETLSFWIEVGQRIALRMG